MHFQSRYSLPSALETRATATRSQVALGLLKVEGLKVKYTGPGEDDNQAATIRTNHPAPQDCPLYYYEVEIVARGAMGFIGIGYMTEDVLQARLPGWEAHSYGYHGDDGYAFSGSGQGRPYGPTYTTGDVVGTLFNRVDRTIRYFKNGVDLGVAFAGVTDERLFPCVGLRSQGEEVLLNLGTTSSLPFRADFEAMKGALRDQILTAITAIPLPLVCGSSSSPGATVLGAGERAASGAAAGPGPGSVAAAAAAGDNAPAGSSVGVSGVPGAVPLLPRLVADHLAHTRCWRTAAILTRDLLAHGPSLTTGGAGIGASGGHTSASPSLSSESAAAGDAGGDQQQVSDTAARQAVFEAVCEGRILDARGALSARYGARFLESNPTLDFRLKVAHFCELVRAGGPGALEAALTYGRTVLAPHTPKTAEDEEVLADALSLLAYDSPADSPCGHLLREPARLALAETVNTAVLAAQGLPPTSPLERLVAQAITTVDVLRGLNHPQALMLDVRKLCLSQPPANK